MVIQRSLSGDDATAIVGDAVGGHWIGTDKGLNYLAAGGKTFLHFRADPPSGARLKNPAALADDYVRSLLLDRHGRLWIGGDGGLQGLRADGKGFERVVADQGDGTSLSGQKVTALFEAADGKVWIGTGNHGTAWLRPEDPKLNWVSVDTAQSDRNGQAAVRTIVQPQADQIWLGSFGGGITIVSSADGRELRHSRHDPSIASSIASDIIGDMQIDRSGQLWVGTWSGGLQRHAIPDQAFRILRHSPKNPASLSNADVHSILQLEDGHILIGTNNQAIDIADPARGVVGGYRPHPENRGPLSDDIIIAMSRAPDGALWVGTQQAGILRLTPGTEKWHAYSVTRNHFNPSVNGVLVSRSGEIFAGTDDGLRHWLAGKAQFESYRAADGSPMQAPVYPLIEDDRRRIWAGTPRGLWVLEPGAKALQAIHPEPTRPASLVSDLISGLLVDRKGRLWVATESGLERLRSWDGQRAEFDHISATAGRPGQDFGANLLEDADERIWSENHLFDPKRTQIFDLTKADGLDFGTPWTGSYGRTRDGLFMFGGTQGLAVVDPAKFHPWDYQPPLIATELKINGIAQPLGTLEPTLKLRPEQRNFTIEFAALDFSAPQKNLYSYRLQGYDKDWINTDAGHRSASYGNLWPGRYLLQVRGSNRVGDWSPHELSIDILVLPAFWQSGWFFTLMLIVVGSCVYGGYRWRLALLQSKARALQTLVNVRTGELIEKNRELEKLAVTDRLTKLFNRLKLDERLDEQFARAERYGVSFALVLLDVDHFKSINDIHGHQIGDQVLVELAAVLSANTRDLDIVGRWGGEEFLIIASDTDMAGATELAEKLRKSVADHRFRTVGTRTASFGVAAYRPGDSIGEMLTRADRALYRGKESGRNRVECEP